MSMVNLGLQAVALVREKLPEEIEAEAARYNSLKTLHALAKRKRSFVMLQ